MFINFVSQQVEIQHEPEATDVVSMSPRGQNDRTELLDISTEDNLEDDDDDDLLARLDEAGVSTDQ